MIRSNLQLDEQGQLKHFLSVEGLKRQTLIDILDAAEPFATPSGVTHSEKSPSEHGVKKVPVLRGKTIVNLFFEASTRTRTTFELAAKRLSADVLNINISTSATSKGESLLDMLHNLESMHCDMFIVRHNQSGAAHFIAQHVSPHISVINAGDGCHAHPSQAMLDMFTIRRHKHEFGHLKVAVVGDILHSRVARSQIHALTTLGVNEVRVVGPKTLIPNNMSVFGAHVYHDLAAALKDVDVIIMLRLQKERMQGALLPSAQEYYNQYGLSEEKLACAKPDAIVMHPGPINRGVEIASSIADGPQSVILEQVTNGIAVRMGVMSMVLGRRPKARKNTSVESTTQ